jgi:hypothetical protein
MQDAVLAAFLIIDDELHRDAGFARPNGPRPVAAITDQIARICSMSNKPLCSQVGIVHEILVIVDNHKAGASDPPKTGDRGEIPGLSGAGSFNGGDVR